MVIIPRTGPESMARRQSIAEPQPKADNTFNQLLASSCWLLAKPEPIPNHNLATTEILQLHLRTGFGKHRRPRRKMGKEKGKAHEKEMKIFANRLSLEARG